MRGMNQVVLLGNLGKDPELKELPGAVVVVKVALATTDIFRGKDGVMRSGTQWHTVIFWNSIARLAAKYLKKGSMVLVTGKIAYRKYADKAGVLRYVTEIVADELIMLDKPVKSSLSSGPSDPSDSWIPF